MDKSDGEIIYLLKCYRDTDVDKTHFLERVEIMYNDKLISEEAFEFVSEMLEEK